ncbi:hypothetical protein [Aerosakkonema funiforme]
MNKIKQGDFLPYNHDDFPNPPECWQCSFTDAEPAFLEKSNISVKVPTLEYVASSKL